MEVHVAVLGPGSEAHAIRRKGECMYGTEMASDVTEVLVVDYAHHFDGETTLGGLGSGDLTRVLTTCQENVELLHLCVVEQGADRCSSARLNEFEDSNGSECLRVQELSLAVSRACNQHGMIIGNSEREDLALVHIGLCDDLIVLPVMNDEASLVSRDVHGLVQGTPGSLSDDIVLRACNLLNPIGILVQGSLKIVDTDVRSLVVIVDNQELLVTQGEFDMLSLDVGHWDGGSYELLSIHHVENAEPECSSRRQDILGVLCHVHGFDGLLNREYTDTCAIISVVHADVSVIGACEKEVSIEVIHNFSHGTRVARQVDRLHL